MTVGGTGPLCDKRSVTLYLHVEDAGDADGTANSIQTQRCNVLVITILQAHTECSQEGRPCHLHTHTHTQILKQILDVAVTGNFFPFLEFAGGITQIGIIRKSSQAI